MCSCVDTRIASTLLIFLALAGQSVAFSEDNLIDEYGRLKRMALGHGWIDVQSDIRIPNSGWKKSLTLGNTEKAATTLGYGEQTWSSRVADNPMEYDIEQTAQSSEGKIVFKIKVTARQSAFIEGVYFWLDIPEELFAGGTYIAGRETGALPLEQRQQLCATITDKFMFFDAGAKTCIAATLNRPASVQINDQRRYGENYSAFIVLHPGTLWRGDSTELELTLEALGDGDSAAQLSMDAETARYPFKGFGGNYAFAIESPVTRYTLDHLQVAFARTEMSLAEWEPKLDKAEVTERIEWEKLLERDQDGSRLRHEFELMQEFSRKKIPYVTSIWQLPDWMYAHPPKDRDATGNKLAEGMWPKLLECIGSYLLYAREKYHAEPDYFSFNEPDIGIRVLFSADEHRAAIRRLGEHFEKLKLKTKLLLGDCGNPRGTISYTYPGIFDADALKYTAALSFHSWGGATPKQYGEWADMAARVHLPLFVTEAGVDPAAWRDGTFQNFNYGLREAMHYQKLLLYARPQAVVFWEYSDDYSLLSRDPASNKLALTERFCMQKQFTDLTPAGSEALNTSSDQPGILFTAFRYAQKQEHGFTLHLVNSLWTRKVVIEGVPQSLFKLNCVQTSRGKLFETLGAVDVQLGRIEMELPAQSLTTLTTLALPELVKP